MKEIDVFCKDLILKSKIKEIAAQQGISVRVFRSTADYQTKELIPSTIIILNANEYESQFAEFQELQLIAENQIQIMCFVAHVDTDIISKAKEFGLTNIQPRSSFFTSLAEKIS